jgi:hypothetical protein
MNSKMQEVLIDAIMIAIAMATDYVHLSAFVITAGG